nr:MAG: glycoprotein [Rhabdoviridae sp.]
MHLLNMKILFVFFPLIRLSPAAPQPHFSAPYFAPKNLQYPWHPIPAASLRCPPLHPVISGEGIPAHIESPVKHDIEGATIGGYSCYGSTFKVKCVVNFVGWRSFEHVIVDLKVTSQICREKIGVVESGGLPDSPIFPPPSCSWWSENWSTLDHVFVLRHPVAMDPYSSVLLDPLFPGGRCDNKECPLIHHGGLWLQTEALSSSCADWSRIPVTIGLVGDQVMIVPHVGPPMSLQGSCMLRYCQRLGIRLSDGEFIRIEDFKGRSRILPNPPICSDGVTIKALSETADEDRRELSSMEETDRLNCISRLSVALATNKISPELLGSLTPRHAGVDKAYRLRDGVLEYANVEYVPLSRPSNLTDPFLIGYSPKGSRLEWNDWVVSSNISFGPNGIVRPPNSTVIIPNFERLKVEYDQVIQFYHDLREVPHPKIRYYSNHSDLQGFQFGNVASEGSNWEVFSGWWSSIWGSFTWTVGLGLVGLIVIWCLMRRCGRNPVATQTVIRSPSRWEDIEMQ